MSEAAIRLLGVCEREQAFAARSLQEAHRAHVTESKQEKQQEGNRTPHVQTGRVNDREQKIDGETQFQEWQPTTFAAILLRLPGFIGCFFNPVLWSAHEVCLNAEQGLEHGTRIRKCEPNTECHH